MKDSVQLQQGDTLLIVDVQNDFLPGGALAVSRGDEVVAMLNSYISLFLKHDLPVFATRDWHPANHCSFHVQGGIWPPHCVAHSHGAEFAENLNLPQQTIIISKAMQTNKDAYSGFENTDLDEQLRQRRINRIFIGGLATDYCVLNTAIDAIKHQFKTYVLIDAIRAVDVEPGDGEKAIAKMRHQGVLPISLKMVETN